MIGRGVGVRAGSVSGPGPACCQRALQPGWDSPGRLSRRAAAPRAPVHILAQASTEQDQYCGCGFVDHHPALDFGPRWASVALLGWLLFFARHDPSPHDCDGLESLGARCSGVLVLGSGSRALAISSFRIRGSARFEIRTGQRNGEPPLGRLPVNRTRAV